MILLIFVYISIYMAYRFYKLLIGISDDINEIKEKFGLPIRPKTRDQSAKEFKKIVKFVVYKGGNLKEHFRERDLSNLKYLIQAWSEEAKNGKFCYFCERTFNSSSDGFYKNICPFCAHELQLTKPCKI